MLETGLLSKKSRVSYQRLYRLPEGSDLPGLNVELKNKINDLKEHICIDDVCVGFK